MKEVFSLGVGARDDVWVLTHIADWKLKHRVYVSFRAPVMMLLGEFLRDRLVADLSTWSSCENHESS
jgi:hypothetical protein